MFGKSTVFQRGTLKIKNISGESYSIKELSNHTIENDEIIDLLDPDLPVYYDMWQDANRLCTSLTTAQLYQDIQDNKIEIIENTPPSDKGFF
jgi:hypothetical protein